MDALRKLSRAYSGYCYMVSTYTRTMCNNSTLFDMGYDQYNSGRHTYALGSRGTEKMTVFKFDFKKGITEPWKVHDVLYSGAKEGLTPGSIMTNLKSHGMAYRKKDMLYDIGLMKSGIKAKTDYAEDRAHKWFTEFFEPMREKTGLSRKALSAKITKWHRDEPETSEEEEEFEEMEDEYEDAVGKGFI